MASKAASPDKLTSSDDIYENFVGLYSSEAEKPPAPVLARSSEEIPSRTVPTARFTSVEYHEREVRELWQRVWQVACWGGDIPRPGDTALYDNAGTSAFIVRQKDGSLKAFYNSCLHRGMRLCHRAGNRSNLVCPFHGYAWDLRGECQSIPQAWDFPELKRENLKLPELAVAQWQGFVFVHPNPDAEPLERFLGALPAQWEASGWSFDDRFKAAHVTRHIRANWKVAQEAFMEGYHAAMVHPRTILPAAAYETMRADVYPGERHFSRGLGTAGVLPSEGQDFIAKQQAALDHFVRFYMPGFQGRDDLRVTEDTSARDIMHRLATEKLKEDTGADVSGMSRFDVIDYCWYNVFPNFMPWPTLGYPLAYWFRPGDGPDSCTMDILLLLPFGGERPASAERVELGFDDPCEPHLGPVGAILDEDMANIPLIQQGLRASQTGEINLSRQFESRIRHFHRTLGEYVDDAPKRTARIGRRDDPHAAAQPAASGSD